jgi:AraC-like DNA-binding protein
MILEYGKLERPFLDPRADLHGAWGTLGEPAGPAGAASLLHLFRTRNVTLRHAFYAPEALVAQHVHAVPSFVYGDGGPCREISGSVGESKRRLTFHPAGYRHELRYEGPTNVLAVEVTGEVGELPERSVGLPATLYGEIWNILTAVALLEPPSRIDRAVAALVVQTMSIAQRPHPRWLTSVLDQVHARWDTPPSARELAAASGVSTYHLCRAFKRWMGVTTRQYGLLLRLDRARHQLWATDAPLSQVAAETGFTDQSHLCRALASWQSMHRPGKLRAIRPTRLEAHNHAVTEAARHLSTTKFVGTLP